MATVHPRIAVIRDSELDRALTISDPLLTATERRSQASRVHALAIRGARAIAEQSAEDTRAELAFSAMSAQRPTADWSSLPAPVRLSATEGVRPGTAALADARGDR